MSRSAHSVFPYFLVYAALMALLALTTGVAFIDLGALNFPVAMAIAVIKALLVILIFMHVADSPRLIWLAVGGAAVWLLILIGLTLADYMTRSWDPYQPSIHSTTEASSAVSSAKP